MRFDSHPTNENRSEILIAAVGGYFPCSVPVHAAAFTAGGKRGTNSVMSASLGRSHPLGVSLQWWLVGLWLQRPVPLARVLRLIIACMTAPGIVMTLAAISSSVVEIDAIRYTVEALLLVVVLGWVLLMVTGAISVAIRGAKSLRTVLNSR